MTGVLLFVNNMQYPPFISHPYCLQAESLFKNKIYHLRTTRPQMVNILLYGTGSYPPFEKGLHRSILHPARILPLTAPYFSIASRPYAEQVGKYGHFAILTGDIYR